MTKQDRIIAKQKELIEHMKSMTIDSPFESDFKKQKRLESELAALESEPEPVLFTTTYNETLTCDTCGCHPSVLITTNYGRFCELHARYTK